MPSSSCRTPASRACAFLKAEIAPVYAGSSTSTTSPGLMSTRPTRSIPCCDPDVMVSSIGSGGDVTSSEHLDDRLEQRLVAPRRSVLQNAGIGPGQQPGRDLAEFVPRKRSRGSG